MDLLRRFVFRWRGERRKLRRDFETAIEDTLRSHAGFRPYCPCTRQESERLCKQIGRLPMELESDLRKAQNEESLTLSSAIKKVSSYGAKLNDLRIRDVHWRALIESMLTAAMDLRKSSASFPGEDFARDVDAKKRKVDVALKELSAIPKGRKKQQKFPSAGEVDQKIAHAQQQLVGLRHLIDDAEELIRGEPMLAAAIARVSELGVEQDIQIAQKYRTLLRMYTDVQSNIKKNAYPAGRRTLDGARALCSSVQQDLEKRFDITRQEINLWLTDPEICAQFNLQSFPQHLTREQSQKWTDIRLEIRELVDARAERARHAYYGLNIAKRNLRFTLKELHDWDNLEAFARSAQKNSAYR